MEDDRRQKVEAAKQTFAKYRKKKTRQTKITQTKDGTGERTVIDTVSTATNLVDDKNESEVGPNHGEVVPSDLDHISGITHLDDEPLNDQQSAEHLEDQVSSYESAADDIIRDLPVPEKQVLDSLEDYSNKLKEFEEALVCRDEVIRVLSSNLRKMTENRDTLQMEYTGQANQLMQQVHLLQQQLKQAGNWLHIQDHGFSAQALLEAKNELLALRENCHQKENQLTILQNLIHERDSTLQQIIVRFNESTRDFAQIHEENERLKECLATAEAEVALLQTEHNALKAEKEEYNSMLHELQADSGSVEKESAKLLMRLQQENEVLKRKDQEHSEVVKQLMADVETRHKLREVSHSELQRSSLSEVSYSKEELDLEIEKQLNSLRAELDEIYGTEIGQMKEYLHDQHRVELEKLNAELCRTTEERNRFSSQVDRWQQQYVRLSQQNVSSTDLVEQLSVAVSENIHQKQLNEELRTRLKLLSDEQLAKIKAEEQRQFDVAANVVKTGQVDLDRLQKNLREQMHVLQMELNVHQEAHNNDLMQIKSLELELDSSQKEFAQAAVRYANEMEALKKEASADIEQLGLQLAESQKHIKVLESQASDGQLAAVELSRLKEQLSHLQLDHAQQIATLKIEYEKYVIELKSYHQAELETLTQQHEWKMNELQTTIKNQRQEQQDLLRKQLCETEKTYLSQLENFRKQKEKKEKSTDCDSALIPLLCVHG